MHVEAAMAAPSLWDSYLAYLRTQGFETDEVAAAVLAAYRDDGGPPSSPSTSSTSTRASRVAVPTREDGRAHHRRQASTGDAGAACLRVDALPPGVPRAVGRAEPAVTVTLTR